MTMLIMDFISPIPPAYIRIGFKYILVAVDYFSRFV
jgi:hypothetical protein